MKIFYFWYQNEDIGKNEDIGYKWRFFLRRYKNEDFWLKMMRKMKIFWCAKMKIFFKKHTKTNGFLTKMRFFTKKSSFFHPYFFNIFSFFQHIFEFALYNSVNFKQNLLQRKMLPYISQSCLRFWKSWCNLRNSLVWSAVRSTHIYTRSHAQTLACIY